MICYTIKHLRCLGVIAFLFARMTLAQADEVTAPSGSSEIVIRALLAAKPTTPVELIRAARVMVDLGEPAQALPLLQRLAAKKLSDGEAAHLVREVGSATLLRLTRQRELSAVAGPLSTAIFDAAQRFARDPARLAEQIGRLAAATPLERANIVEELRPAGDAAVVALVNVLADKSRTAEHPQVCAALVDLGTVSSVPLVAVLSTADSQLLARVIDVLGNLDDRSIAGQLLAPALLPEASPEVVTAGRRALARYYQKVPSVTQAGNYLARRAQQSLDAVRQPGLDAEPGLEQQPLAWQWDDQTKVLTSARVSRPLYELLRGVQFATDAHRLLPESESVRRLRLVALAQAIAYAGDGAGVAPRIAAARSVLSAASVEELQDLLSYCLEQDQPGAASVAAQQLGEAGDVHVLSAHTPQDSALVRALLHPSRDLRFAALSSIMQLDPREPYPGSSRVAEGLEFFARSTGIPRALVASTSAEEAARIAGLLAELGYETDTATDVVGVLKHARVAGDYEVIFVDSALAMPAGAQLLQLLRSDSRLARIPVAVVSLAEEFPQVERVTRRFPLCLAVMRTHNPAGTQFELNRVLQAAGHTVTPGDVRRAQGAQAVAWIAQLAAERETVYDVQRFDAAVIASMDAPGLTAAAIAALAKLDTAYAQRALADLASRLAAPLETRRAAAKAFAESVARRGTLLTSEEILRQYDRYNASEKQDADTQRVLASLLDTIEARAQADWLTLEPNESPAP